MTIDGPAAPPRANGELVFAEPWESRAFGLAGTLEAAGACTWDEFRAHLVVHLAAEPGRPYYRSWLLALESLVEDHGLLGRDELQHRAAHLAAQPDGHDHG